MTTHGIPQDRAVEELEQLGLRKYEARCFVALVKIRSGTAREVSEQIDVPRTRVYEAVRSLESCGLVEIQHSSPQRFRAIPVPEAIEVLQGRYRERIDSLEGALEGIQQSADSETPDIEPEVWSFTGTDTIMTRAKRLIDDANSGVLFLAGDSQALSAEISDRLNLARDRDVDVFVGLGSEQLREQFSGTLPETVAFDPEFEWFQGQNGPNGVSVCRLLLVDDERLLVSAAVRSDGQIHERAISARESSIGLVFLLRQLLADRFDV